MRGKRVDVHHAPGCELLTVGWLDESQREYRYADGWVQIGAHWGDGRESCPRRDSRCTCGASDHTED